MIVAQVSDIHAAVRNDNLSLLDRALAWLASIKPDALVVSGDLIDDGWIEGYRQIAGRFERLPYPVFVLPGNSDDRDLMRAQFASSDTQSTGLEALHFVTDIAKTRIVGVDTSLSGMAEGDVTEHLAWIEMALQKPGASTSLLFMHHHVFRCGIEPLDKVMCRGVDRLGQLLEPLRAKPLGILTGHVHRPMSGMVGDIPAHICGSICVANPLCLTAGTVSPTMDPPMLMIHHVSDGALVSCHVSV